MTFLEEFIEKHPFKSARASQDYRLVIERVTSTFGENLETISASALISFVNGPFSIYEVEEEGKTKSVKYTAKTQVKNQNILRSFFTFLATNGLTEDNYGHYIETLNQEVQLTTKDLPVASEINQITTYLMNDTYKSDYFVLRNLVLFNLIVHSGLSPLELMSINVDSVGFFGSNFVVKVTTPKFREIHVNDSDASLLSRLIELHSLEGAEIDSSGTPLFIGAKTKGRLPTRSIGFVIHKLCEDAGVSKYSPDKFKKAGITAALSLDYPIKSLAKDLGVNPAYFKHRTSNVVNEKVTKSYADLFNKEV